MAGIQRDAAGREVYGEDTDIVAGGGGGGGGGGGAVTIADGADTAEGATTAAAYSDNTGAAAGTVVGLLKGAYVRLIGIGVQADAAYTGAGNAGLVGIAKGLYAALTGTLKVQSTTLTPTAGTNLGGTVTTTSGGFNIPANAARRPGDVQGQNTGANPIAFNEFGGTAVIGGTTSAPTGDANSYVVPPLGTFSITTTNQVNFIALTGSSTVAITRNS